MDQPRQGPRALTQRVSSTRPPLHGPAGLRTSTCCARCAPPARSGDGWRASGSAPSAPGGFHWGRFSPLRLSMREPPQSKAQHADAHREFGPTRGLIASTSAALPSEKQETVRSPSTGRQRVGLAALGWAGACCSSPFDRCRPAWRSSPSALALAQAVGSSRRPLFCPADRELPAPWRRCSCSSADCSCCLLAAAASNSSWQQLVRAARRRAILGGLLLRRR